MFTSRRSMLLATVVTVSMMAAACGDDSHDQVVWDLREPATPRSIGGRSAAVVEHRGADGYVVRLPGRDVIGPFRTITGVASASTGGDASQPIDEVELAFDFASSPSQIDELLDIVDREIAPADDAQAAIESFADEVRAAAESGSIDVAELQPGTVGRQTSLLGLSSRPGEQIVLRIGEVDTGLALSLVISFDPAG